MKPIVLFFFLLFSLTSCNEFNKPVANDGVQIDTLQGTSLLEKPLIRRQVNANDSLQINNYLEALENYSKNSLDPENVIWLGRRMAYLGDYKAAIGIFHEGILKFPNDARFYRHRGHRYISTRKIDLAIRDLETADILIKNKEDVIEPDGIPNHLNQPVSSLHTNIYYHLGLAYYLKNELTNALAHFDNCLQASQNDDMIVASKHWMYMILRRMELPDEAEFLLESITEDMTIIENEAYHNLLLYYKGILNEDDLDVKTSIGSSEAVQYGIANWHHYNGQLETAKAMYEYILANGNWAAFGYIAAEADLVRLGQ